MKLVLESIEVNRCKVPYSLNVSLIRRNVGESRSALDCKI